MKISIITTSFNSAQTIEDTIKSVLYQTFNNVEYIVIDGGSTDKTLDILNKYKDKIRIISEKDNGVYDAMNKGVSISTGDIVGILNSDDIYNNENVLKTVADNFSSSRIEIAWGDIVYVKKNDISIVTRRWKSSPYVSGCFQKGWQPPHPSVFVTRDVYQKYGLYRTNMKISSDYEFLLRVLEKYKIRSLYISETFVRMREGGVSHWRNIWNVMKGNIECYRSWKYLGLKSGPYFILLKLLNKIKQIN